MAKTYERYIILLAVVYGFIIALIDLRSVLGQISYYIGLNLLIVSIIISFTYKQKNIFLSFALFFGIYGFWNLIWGVMARATNQLRFPLNLGLGMHASYFSYFAGTIIELGLFFGLLYLSRVKSLTRVIRFLEK
ncbi:hypothetical protein M1293_00455 [Candidatus Parvarchaeota archaeon]|nr:hypothetical protein [Candidatus Parvarchaeota archaeon]